MKCEVAAALKAMKRRKAVGPDKIAIEMIIALDELGIEKVTELANIIYESANIPDDLCKSIFIAFCHLVP